MTAIPDVPNIMLQDMATLFAGKLIGTQLSADDHAKLIEQYVAEVGGLNDN